MGTRDIGDIIVQAIVLFLGVGIHEYAHCKMADLAGDPTPRIYGRVTLNLTKHFEPIGTLFMVLTSITGFGLGWGRPAPMDPKKMRNPRWDLFAAVAAGPISNLFQALIWAALLRFVVPAVGSPFFYQLAFYGVLINLSLAIFNLIPFGPLDGHWLVGLLLPERLAYRWFQFNRQVGFIGLFVAVMVLSQAKISLTAGPVAALFKVFTGISLR